MKYVIEFVFSYPAILISFVVGAVLAILMLTVKVKIAFLPPCVSIVLSLVGLLAGLFKLSEFGFLLFLLGLGSFFGYLISYPLTYAIKNFRPNKNSINNKNHPKK